MYSAIVEIRVRHLESPHGKKKKKKKGCRKCLKREFYGIARN